MKKSQITLIIIGFILLALMATNPSIEDHREGVKKIYRAKLEKINKQQNGDLGTQIGTGIASLIGDGFIDKIVSRENYLLFSLTKLSLGNKSKYAGIGILGKVFIKNYHEIKSSLGSTSAEVNDGNLSKNEIDYIQVGEIQLYKKTSYGTKGDALKFATQNKGWRLPTVFEMEQLNQFSDKLEFIQCESFWATNAYGEFERVDINRCDNGYTVAYPMEELNILLVRNTAYPNAQNESDNLQVLAGIDIANSDLPSEMTWVEAVEACSNLGSGWRLPTITELKNMCENKKSIGGFKDGDFTYWSSTELGANSSEDGFVEIIHFAGCIGNSSAQDGYKKDRMRVRVVRNKD